MFTQDSLIKYYKLLILNSYNIISDEHNKSTLKYNYLQKKV